MSASRLAAASAAKRGEAKGVSNARRIFAVLKYFLTQVLLWVASLAKLGWERLVSGAQESSSSAPVRGADCREAGAGRASPPTSGSMPSKAAARRRANGAKASKEEVPPPEPVFEPYVEKDRPETATEKRIRALRKKVREIDALQERTLASGKTLEDLDPAQAEKIATRPALEREIQELLVQAAQEDREAQVRAAAEAEEAAARAAAAEAEAARLAAERAAAEAALAKQRREALEVIPNISPASEATRNDSRLKELLKQVSELSLDIFAEDPLKNGGVSKKSGWRLSILARPIPVDPENAPPEEPTELLGFMVFRFRPDMQCLSVAKIAVPEKHRGRGFGRRLMEWVTKYAKQQSDLQYLSLSSLPEAVKFYQAFGFKKVKVDAVKEHDEDLIEGQEYMEYRLRGGRR
eukprot:TRINITY_DN22068_c0_g1_i1.p1 TRINITY_DN22068_c0_g1~~TRINITY_DN22068_c0_g1_i1.p1  ORF type:complete len:408 (+),score=119.99 TRINITY_DN22068_c0_g1_i1:60-1283(+)